MNEKIKKAFDQIQAESELKNAAKDYIFQKTKGYTRAKPAAYRRLISAFACTALILIVGYWLCLIPTAEISIDINPSVELGINRFNRVISLKGYNDDGSKLADTLDVMFLNYSDAVNQIIENDSITSLLSGDEILTIAVTGTDHTQSEEIYSDIQVCMAGNSSAYCCYVREDDANAARKAGLSFGKYKAFLELHALDPGITADEVQDMTMREIRDLISSLSGAEESASAPSEAGSGNGNGEGNGGNHNGQGKKTRRGGRQ